MQTRKKGQLESVFFVFQCSPAVVPEPGGTGGWPGGRRDEGAGFSALRTFLVGPTPRSGSAYSEGRSSSSKRSGRRGLHICAEGQTATVAVKLLHSEGRASGPLRRQSAVLEKSSAVGMMAMESAGLAAHSDCEYVQGAPAQTSA